MHSIDCHDVFQKLDENPLPPVFLQLHFLQQHSHNSVCYDVLYGYVLSRLQYWSEQVHRDDEKLLQQLLNAGNKERSAAKRQRAVELKKAIKRKSEVDGLFTKLYEDWSLGKITEYNFTMLSERFQTEQRELETIIRELQEALSSMEQTESDAGKWLELIKQYSNPTELTTELLNTLIEKIVVHEALGL